MLSFRIIIENEPYYPNLKHYLLSNGPIFIGSYNDDSAY